MPSKNFSNDYIIGFYDTDELEKYTDGDYNGDWFWFMRDLKNDIDKINNKYKTIKLTTIEGYYDGLQIVIEYIGSDWKNRRIKSICHDLMKLRDKYNMQTYSEQSAYCGASYSNKTSYQEILENVEVI